jgi:hypothetical protein
MIFCTIFPILFLVKPRKFLFSKCAVSISISLSHSLFWTLNLEQSQFSRLSCYNVLCSPVLPVCKLGNLQPAATERLTSYTCFAFIFRGFFLGEGGWSRVVSRTKPSLHPSGSRIYRKIERGGGACWGWSTWLAPCQKFLQLCQEATKPLWFVYSHHRNWGYDRSLKTDIWNPTVWTPLYYTWHAKDMGTLWTYVANCDSHILCQIKSPVLLQCFIDCVNYARCLGLKGSGAHTKCLQREGRLTMELYII